MHFIRSDNVKEKNVGSELALYVGAQRSIHVLNPTARFIWESLREPLTFDELLFVMTEAFEVDQEVLRHDLQDVLDQFRSLDILHTRAEGDGTAVS